MGFGSKYARKLAQRGASDIEEQIRSRRALEDLLQRALDDPRRVTRLSRETFEGIPTGKPVAVIEVALEEAIGRTQAGLECRVLRVITDITGRPLTAFPAAQTLAL